MSVTLLFFLVILFLFGLVGSVVWLAWRRHCPVPAPNGRTLCARPRGHAGRHLMYKSEWVEFDDPRTPSGRPCQCHGTNDEEGR